MTMMVGLVSPGVVGGYCSVWLLLGVFTVRCRLGLF